jgi:phosphatidylglycerol:prolipoprotein diacylglycerol transferase
MAWRRGALKYEGLIGGTFLAGYGLARFLVEFVRQPDAQFVSAGNPLGLAWHVGGYGLTMGQILSLPMILVGLYLIVRARRRG